jgi:uncharacterized membrane protein HdeD (DUF308 family)
MPVEDSIMAGVSGLVVASAIVVGVAATWAIVRGIARLRRGLRHADQDSASLDVVRGIRAIVMGVAVAALGSGLLFEQTWLVAFGAVFLAEELYETGVLLLVLRAQARA